MNQESYWLEYQKRYSTQLVIFMAITLVFFVLAMLEIVEGYFYKPTSLIGLIMAVSFWVITNRKAAEAKKMKE